MKNERYIKSENIISKINNFIEICNKGLLIILFIMLVCIYSRELIKDVLMIIGISNEIISLISKFSHLLIRIFLILLIGYGIILTMYYLIRKIYINVYSKNQKYRYNEMLKSSNTDKSIKELYKNIYNYFSDENNNIPIFISGEWGAGKTYTINYFLDEYYKYSKQNIYRISCFGITTKEALMKRISDACKNEDKSIFNQIISLIGEIPIVGVFLKSILERKYDINNLKNNSIFIFDNFERIEWSQYGKSMGNITTNYENAICKYDIVVGIIDELIEKYKMKVIIIGNEEEMVPNYMYDTFICKLGCKKYNIIPKYKIFEDIWYEILNKIIMKNSDREEFIKILEEVKMSSIIIWKLEKNNNIRILYKIIYNYINFILFLKGENYRFDEYINEKISIYYTNFLINLKDYYMLNEIRSYESIGLYFEKKLINEKDTKYTYLTMINAMWCSNRNIKNLWENLENNYYEIKIQHENFMKEYRKKYISKKNCIDTDLDLDVIFVEDLFCLLKFGKREFRENAMLFLDKGIVEFKDINHVGNMMNLYKINSIFEKDKELLIKFFERLNNKYDMKSCTDRLSRAYVSFKICNDLYKEESNIKASNYE